MNKSDSILEIAREYSPYASIDGQRVNVPANIYDESHDLCFDNLESGLQIYISGIATFVDIVGDQLDETDLKDLTKRFLEMIKDQEVQIIRNRFLGKTAHRVKYLNTEKNALPFVQYQSVSESIVNALGKAMSFDVLTISP